MTELRKDIINEIFLEHFSLQSKLFELLDRSPNEFIDLMCFALAELAVFHVEKDGESARIMIKTILHRVETCYWMGIKSWAEE